MEEEVNLAEAIEYAEEQLARRWKRNDEGIEALRVLVAHANLMMKPREVDSRCSLCGNTWYPNHPAHCRFYVDIDE